MRLWSEISLPFWPLNLDHPSVPLFYYFSDEAIEISLHLTDHNFDVTTELLQLLSRILMIPVSNFDCDTLFCSGLAVMRPEIIELVRGGQSAFWHLHAKAKYWDWLESWI
jgi:hypothetical protein